MGGDVYVNGVAGGRMMRSLRGRFGMVHLGCYEFGKRLRS